MPALTVPAATKHTATVIMAHGLGDTGYGWESLARNWRARDKLPHVKFIFPHAPPIPITVNFGAVMPGWYDIKAFDDLQGRSQDDTGILKSRDYLTSLIEAEVASGIPASRIVLGGFSQGGAMALFSGVTYKERLAGIFGLSAYMLMHTKLREYIPADNPNKTTPIFLGHGDADPLVKYVWAQKTLDILKSEGFQVELKTYPGLQHSADPDEIDDVEKYLNERIPPTEAGD